MAPLNTQLGWCSKGEEEKDLWTISDQMSGTVRRYMLEDLRDLGGM